MTLPDFPARRRLADLRSRWLVQDPRRRKTCMFTLLRLLRKLFVPILALLLLREVAEAHGAPTPPPAAAHGYASSTR